MKILMRTLIAGLLFLGAASGHAEAQTTYIAPTGTDTGNCQSQASPCATMQYADSQIGQIGSINFADGTYDQTLNVQYYQLVQLIGDCTAGAQAVVLQGASGQTVLEAQDQAILTVSCLTINAPNGDGFVTRQFAIGDITRVIFGSASIDILAGEKSKINCLGQLVLAGSVTYFAAATGQSQALLDCPIDVDTGVGANSFLYAVQQSYIETNGATFGGSLASGAQYILDNSQLSTSPVTLPGNPGSNIVQHNAVVE